ncbi:MAG: hypothetical protein WC831_02315 [Parcubacteria group bacterium]
MNKFVTKIKVVGIALVMMLGLGAFIAPKANAASHSMSTNQEQLIKNVQDANAGWDWRPRCAGGAHWSWNDMRCKGGTGHNHDNDD